MTLQTNRYGQVSPTAVLPNGVAVSVPFYISPTTDQLKQLLNAFRFIRDKQLVEMGHTTTRVGNGSISIETFVKPPITPIEQQLGCDEENLRHALFTRNGIQERLLLKLQRLTGIELVSREQVEETYQMWLDNLYAYTYSADATQDTPTDNSYSADATQDGQQTPSTANKTIKRCKAKATAA